MAFSWNESENDLRRAGRLYKCRGRDPVAQSGLSVKDRRGAIGASSSRSRLGDSHSETPSEVRKRTSPTPSEYTRGYPSTLQIKQYG